MAQKKDGPTISMAIIAIALAASAVILLVAREANDVRFVPRSENTTTTIVVTLPDGG